MRGRLLMAEPLRAHTSFRVGGPADVLFFPLDREDLRDGLRLAAAHGLPVTVMGRGTNLLVRDGGIRGFVVNLGELSGIEGGEVPPQRHPVRGEGDDGEKGWSVARQGPTTPREFRKIYGAGKKRGAR